MQIKKLYLFYLQGSRDDFDPKSRLQQLEHGHRILTLDSNEQLPKGWADLTLEDRRHQMEQVVIVNQMMEAWTMTWPTYITVLFISMIQLVARLATISPLIPLSPPPSQVFLMLLIQMIPHLLFLQGLLCILLSNC